MEILRINNIKKSFGDKDVLMGLDLSIPEHSIFGFVGRNGAGKTTAMKAILGLLRIDDGEIYVCGKKVAYGETKTNRNIGYLPDVPEFYPFMYAREYLTLCGKILGMKKEEISERTEELLSLVGLSEEKHRIKGFSRGMKQRLGIAQALLCNPKLLICDEPTSALDPIGRKEILDILLSVRDRTTVIFSSHILSDIERICTEVALLHNGKIQIQGTVEELKRAHGISEKFCAEMLDTESMEKLKKAFPSDCTEENDRLIFSVGEEKMSKVLDFISQSRLPLRKIERIEPSLESLFAEVAKK